MHASYDRLRKDFASVLEEAGLLGARFLVCPSVDASERRTADDWKRVCRTLNGIGRIARSHGLVLAYHNHDFEFVPFGDGPTPFHLLATETIRATSSSSSTCTGSPRPDRTPSST